MTKVRRDWEYLTLAAEGHAGQAEAGHDIVCAGISALTEALALALEDDQKRGRVQADIRIDEKSGSLRVHAAPRFGQEMRIRAYYRMAMIGLKAIEDEWPGNIKITEVYENGDD